MEEPFVIYAGYVFTATVTLELLHADDTTTPFALNSGGGDTVESLVGSHDGKTDYTLVQLADSGATGADWANGVVVIEVPASETTKLEGTDAIGEVGRLWIKATQTGEPRLFSVLVKPECAPMGA